MATLPDGWWIYVEGGRIRGYRFRVGAKDMSEITSSERIGSEREAYRQAKAALRAMAEGVKNHD